MTTATRLASIERHLTPRQCVLAYLDDIMRRFGSSAEWLDWQVEAPLSEAPLVKPIKAAKIAAITAAKGQSPEAAAEAERDAILEALFLMHLYIATISGVVQSEVTAEGMMMG